MARRTDDKYPAIPRRASGVPRVSLVPEHGLEDGAVTARKVGEGEIRTRHLNPMDGGRAPLNGGFEDYDPVTMAPYRWTLFHEGDAVVDTGYGREGEASLSFVYSGTPLGKTRAITSDRFPAVRNSTATVTVRFSALRYGDYTAGTLTVSLIEYTQQGDVNLTTDYPLTSADIAEDEWTDYEFDVVLDANTAQLAVSLSDGGTSTVGVWVDGIVVEPKVAEGGGGGTSVPQGVDEPPTSPNADNIEFDGNSDPFAGWDTTGSSLTTQEAGDPDPTATVASTHFRFSETIRPGWGTFQYGKDGASSGYFYRGVSHAFGTDECVVVNLDIFFANATPASNQPGIAIGIGQSIGGARDANNRVYLYLNFNGGGGLKQVDGQRVVGGGYTPWFTAVNYGSANTPKRITHVAILKKSTTYYAYVRGGDTGWVYLGSTGSIAVSPDRLDIDIFAAGPFLPGSPIVSFRYLRFLQALPA